MTNPNKQHKNYGLISPKGQPYTEETFRLEINHLFEHIKMQLDLCGGWLPSLEEELMPKTVGIFRFNPDQSNQLREIAEKLGAIYQKIAKAIKTSAEVLDWLMSRLSDPEKQTLAPFVKSERWATALRADIIFDSQGCARIIEVNSDNVGGVEDIDLHLRYYVNKYRHSSKVADECEVALNTLSDSLQQMIIQHWQDFSNSSTEPNISVVSEDRDVSFFTARYMTHLLRNLGFSANARRPEHHWRIDNNSLAVKEPIQGYSKVDIVLKDWLACEMYEIDRINNYPILRDKFLPIIDSAANQEILALNPFNDRLLFSKELLVVLTEIAESNTELGFYSKLADQIQLSTEDINFIKRFIVPTKRYEPVPDHSVIKPVDSYGGRDVFFEKYNRRIWVCQPTINSSPVASLFRMKPQEKIIREELFTVHGTIIHSEPSGKYRLAGVMTRVGPNPVVNWSQGAQIIPGILTSQTTTQ